MSHQYQFRPIERWPRSFTTDRRYGPFKAGFSDTLELLETELWHLDARNVVIQAAVSQRDLRQDGMLRSGARPEHPGIILSFDSKYGPLSLPCDEMHDWRHNLRAIAMHLHHLRKSTLYGVGRYGEQYKGWAQLPPAKEDSVSSVSQAVDFLHIIAYRGGVNSSPKQVKEDPAIREQVIRAARKAAHPDHLGGSHELFLQVQDAIEILKKALGEKP